MSSRITIAFIKGALLLLLILLQGCASYTVRVDGFRNPDRPLMISPGTTVHVVEDKEAKNPLLDKEVARKIESMLKLKGFTISQFANPGYYILHGYGRGPERPVTRTMPESPPGGTATVTKTGPKGTSYSTVQLPGSTTYDPYTTSVTDKWLSLKVIDGKDYRDSGTTTDVWIGEASVTGEGMDLRDMINYLVVGIFDHFGENTGRKIPVNIPQDDPRVRALSAP